MTDTQTSTLARPSPTDPFGALDEWFDEIAGRIDEAFGLGTPAAANARWPLRAARTDVKDLGDSFQILAELPGIPKEKLEIRVRGNEVEIRAESEEAVTEGTAPKFLVRERRHRGFLRTVELPEPVVGPKAQASLKDGVLTLELPKEHPEPVPSAVTVPVH